ncbi:AAA family ATPase [Lentzea nigeriaca]|uniref:AAA family ATPase n=1 Tax=Lentzea nigeriaca TaxID=1128665 RepID=UPI001958C06E|nr:ATP-binding protein [Lentzea nigeriaca]MBM7857738.1 ABC-type transport system involved in cytochrome c biogenesis ATPase subunit [Lentzea nigeriaca]
MAGVDRRARLGQVLDRAIVLTPGCWELLRVAVGGALPWMDAGRAVRPTGGAKREPGVPGWMGSRCNVTGPCAPPTAARLDPTEPNSATQAATIAGLRTGGAMPQLTALTVNGLFGRPDLNHHITLRINERVTILTGLNGSGKTHVLKILKGMNDLDFASVVKLPIASTEAKYGPGNSIKLTRNTKTGHTSAVITGKRSARTVPSFSVELEPELHFDVPDWLRRVDNDTWFDLQDGDYYTHQFVLENFARERARNPFASNDDEHKKKQPDWLAQFKPTARSIFIATARLDTSGYGQERPTRRDPGRNPRRGRSETIARITEYVERIRSLISEARRRSLAISQRADRSFVSKALDKARAKVNEAVLKERYENISNLHQELHQNGLTEETIGVALPIGGSNPTERRILDVFLDDWVEKLGPLLPVHEKLQLLREIVGNKMIAKEMIFDVNGSLLFKDPNGQPITVGMLSSGEQHLLALYTMLLFAAEPGSLVLIDEPEISLHAAWKHAFVTDVQRIAHVNNLQIVLATHSTAIVNGRWDLVEELSAGV